MQDFNAHVSVNARCAWPRRSASCASSSTRRAEQRDQGAGFQRARVHQFALRQAEVSASCASSSTPLAEQRQQTMGDEVPGLTLGDFFFGAGDSLNPDAEDDEE